MAVDYEERNAVLSFFSTVMRGMRGGESDNGTTWNASSVLPSGILRRAVLPFFFPLFRCGIVAILSVVAFQRRRGPLADERKNTESKPSADACICIVKCIVVPHCPPFSFPIVFSSARSSYFLCSVRSLLALHSFALFVPLCPYFEPALLTDAAAWKLSLRFHWGNANAW